ncbi:hypothetical protein N7462_000058 [Penicillium macrosclerotiorum]|uniref:uncharacterized protein n=1 Tax=Penicillium macrosclerotiorum TaxID=303699 RepID=UPI002547A0BC|nr:uncharacterized protein N7462_000058 [Penicillium macrosclerotiorum]KAJ5698053.1 hypothetical protein N7462_000058 [Penicillium macrosclerotiorum]
MDQLTKFLADNPHIRHATRESPDFAELRSAFIIDEKTSPAIIIQPPSAEDVAALVSVVTRNGLPFTVRVGGHDMFGRSQIQDGVTIDLRALSWIEVDTKTQTARLGGGVITMDMLRELQQYHMTTPHAVTPTVGYVGWATYGGYGLLSATYGLGVDQILSAKVVDAEGILREADETMMLGIRGAGGFVGVIVEVTIKIYPSNQILAGAIFYQSDDLPETIRRYNTNYLQLKDTESIPQYLNLYQCISNGPTGQALVILMIWASSDMDEGQKWLSKVSSWAPVAMNTVAPTTVAAFNEVTAGLVPQTTYGSMYTADIHELTPEVLDVIGTHAPLQPNREVLFGAHELRADTPSSGTANTNTTFDTRIPHFLIEIIPMSSSQNTAGAAIEWGQRFYHALMSTDSANILASTYISLTPSERVDKNAIYGSRYETLKMIKGRYDPQNVFKHSLVQF